MCFRLTVFLVCFRCHEIFEFSCIFHFNFDEPSLFLRRFVHNSWFVTKTFIDFYNSSRNRSINIRCSLNRFNTSERFTLFKFITYIWKVNKDNIPKSSLCKIGNTTSCNITLYCCIFMSFEAKRKIVFRYCRYKS